MLSLKPRQMSDDELVQKLKLVLNACDASELKTKKFVGLLNDYIAYNSGLKIRLELLGKAGYIEQLQKLKKETNQQGKIEKLALNFTREYGFIYEESLDTFNLLIRAMAFKSTNLDTTTLKIVSSVQSGQGNFSKKHIAVEEVRPINEVASAQSKSQSQDTLKSETAGKPQIAKKRKFVRNKFNLGLYLILLTMIPIGFYTLQSKYGAFTKVIDVMKQYFYWPVYNNANAISILVITLAVVGIPFIVNKLFKFNILGFYPLAMLLIQILLITVQPRVPELYLYLQSVIGIIVLASFSLLGFYSIRLPKGAKEYTASRAIMPYYLMTAIWFVSQYIVLTKV